MKSETENGDRHRRGLSSSFLATVPVPRAGASSHFPGPDYLLVRRRVVSRLKTRLRDSERKLVQTRSGYTVFRHDPATLARLRATWASYRAHLKMANSYRLWQRLVSRSDWVRHLFVMEEG